MCAVWGDGGDDGGMHNNAGDKLIMRNSLNLKNSKFSKFSKNSHTL